MLIKEGYIIMNNRVKYTIFFIVLLTTFILSLSIYIESSNQKRVYTKTINTLEDLTIKNYKNNLKDTVETAINYIDFLYLDIKDKESKSQDEIKKELTNKLRSVFYKVNEENKRYVWINEVVNFDGGKDYAIRVIHPNLKNTEGAKLSTFIKDIKGNKPYLVELEGIKKEGEIFFNYYFKELNSQRVSEKITYAKIYKPLNWIVATGIPLNRLEKALNSKKELLNQEYESHFQKIILFGFSLVFLFSVLFFYLYKKISKYTKENITLEKKIIENKVNKKYQKELEKTEEQYRYLMMATQDGVWDWNMITDEVYFSPQLKLMMGYDDHEMESTYENWHDNIHPDDVEQVDKDLKEHLEKVTEYYISRHRLKCKDGSWIWIEDKGKVFYDKNGKALRMIGSHRDISQEIYYQDMLIKKQKQYKDLFYNNASVILLIDPQTKSIINSNKVAEEFYGYSHKEFKKLKIVDINISPLNEIEEKVENILKSNRGEFFVKHKLKSGKIVDVRILSTKTKIDNKTVLHSIVQDVSEELKAKEDLKHTVEELEKIKDNLDFSQKLFHIGSWEYELKINKLYLSDEVYNILEIPKKELTYEEYIEYIYPEDKQKVIDEFKISIEQKRDHEVEYRLLLDNGKIKYIHEKGRNFYSNDEFIKSAGTIYDITRSTLIESNWNSFFSLSLDLLLIADFDGTIIKINPACESILGYSVDEMVGENIYNYLYEKDYQTTKEESIDVINGKKIYNFENRYVHKNGSIISLAWSAVASLEQKVIYSIGQDISELKEKNYMLSQQSKMAAMGEMLGNIAHQWRQPLSLISTLSSGVKLKKELGILENKEFEDSMDNINNTTQFLSHTIDDFRNFFRQDKENKIFKVSDIIDRTLKIVSAQFDNHEIQIVKSIDDCEINALENEFLQVLINVLNNSRDALLEKQKSNRFVFIDVKKEDKNVKISIKDNALGIPEDIIKKVFDPYFTTKHNSQGTGIGLYMSEEIVSKHLNGKIDVKNCEYEYEGNNYKGAEFVITLPLV